MVKLSVSGLAPSVSLSNISHVVLLQYFNGRLVLKIRWDKILFSLFSNRMSWEVGPLRHMILVRFELHTL